MSKQQSLYIVFILLDIYHAFILPFISLADDAIGNSDKVQSSVQLLSYSHIVYYTLRPHSVLQEIIQEMINPQ